MDLYAHSQIDTLNQLAALNSIDIPRLRGYRLMADEKKYSEDEIKKLADEFAIYHVYYEYFYCKEDKYFKHFNFKKYLKHYFKFKNSDPIEIKWDAIHGKFRKTLKFALKNARKRYIKSMSTFNKYAGREDVLYVHSRLGGLNWSCEFYRGDVKRICNSDWFLEKVDDYYDTTYCDIYCKIDLDKSKELLDKIKEEEKS